VNTLPEIATGQLSIVAAHERVALHLPSLIARFALRAPLRVVDAGNCFDALKIAREIRRATPDLQTILQRILLARAFTCYQTLTLLEEIPTGAMPVLALDLLSTFYDESVPLAERQRLLARCTQALLRLSRKAPVGVFVYLRPAQPDSPALLHLLEEAADQVWRLESEAPAPPARLF